MNILFFKNKFLLYLCIKSSTLFSHDIYEKKNINNLENIEKAEEKTINKKKRKVDISILREDLIHELINLLKLIQTSLEKNIENITKKELFTEKYRSIMHVFQWVNDCISKFDTDPSAYGRSDIELYLNQAQKYKLFLNTL